MNKEKLIEQNYRNCKKIQIVLMLHNVKNVGYGRKIMKHDIWDLGFWIFIGMVLGIIVTGFGMKSQYEKDYCYCLPSNGWEEVKTESKIMKIWIRR